MKNAYGLVVTFTLKPSVARQFDELTDQTLVKIKAHEPDTLIYNCHTVKGKPNKRVFYELYKSKSAFDFHEDQDYIQHFLKNREQYLSRTPEVEFLIGARVNDDNW